MESYVITLFLGGILVGTGLTIFLLLLFAYLILSYKKD